jgi:3-oxoacyl-[acyl-carrier protein] reductase
MSDMQNRLLVFGGSGAIGGAIAMAAANHRWEVIATSRQAQPDSKGSVKWIVVDPFADSFSAKALQERGPYTAVCWAQGANGSDSVYNVSLDDNLDLYRSNCLYIVATLRILLDYKLLIPASRLCVISSIWQTLARQSKLSYCMTKAALHGLVLSASVDLAREGHLINAVLPGALDTPMTRANLNPVQLQGFTAATGFGRLATLDDVASLVLYLCSRENSGITGQFISADLGFSNVRLV